MRFELDLVSVKVYQLGGVIFAEHQSVLINKNFGKTLDTVLHTDSASGSYDFGYDAWLKPEAATMPEQSEGKPSLDSRVVASLWNTSLQTMTMAASRLTL